MAKEKIASIEHTRKETVFYYEIIGIICLIISLIAIARFGLAGLYLSLVFKLAFGDWYFVFIGLLFFYGIRQLIIHEPLKLKNMRFFGIVLICLGLLTISHLSYHKYVLTYNQNPFKLTISFYFDAFKKKNFDLIGGGGLFGAAIFYLFYSLFSEIGSVLIATILIYVGISFIFRKTVFEFSNNFFQIIKKILLGGLKFRRTIKYEIKQYDDNGTRKNYKIKAEWLPQVIVHQEQDEEFASYLYNEVVKLINHYHLFYSEITYQISPHLILIVIVSYANPNLNSLYGWLKKDLNYPFLLRYSNNHFYLEFSKKYPLYTNFRKALEITKNEILLGTSPDNIDVKYQLNSHLLICSGGTSNYFETICLLIEHSLQKTKTIIHFLSNQESNCFLNLGVNYQNVSFLYEIQAEIEHRLQLINQLSTSNYEEYNLRGTKKIEKMILLIPNLEVIFEDSELDFLFNEMLPLAKTVGIIVVANLYTKIEVSKIMDQLFNEKILLKNSYYLIKQYIDEEIISKMSLMEGVYLKNNNMVRISLTMLLDNEKDILKKKFKNQI